MQGQKILSELKLNNPLVKISASMFTFYLHAISLWSLLPGDVHSYHTMRLQSQKQYEKNDTKSGVARAAPSVPAPVAF